MRRNVEVTGSNPVLGNLIPLISRGLFKIIPYFYAFYPITSIEGLL
jgi:hypothetical protein